MLKRRRTWQGPSSAPAPPRGAPGGSGRLDTPRGERLGHSVPIHRRGVLERAPFEPAHATTP